MKIFVDGCQDNVEAFVYKNKCCEEEGLYYNEASLCVDIKDESYNEFVVSLSDWNNFVKAVNMMDSKLKELGKIN